MTDALAVVAASWGVMMALSPILQLRRILERRSSADVSISYLGVLQVGFTVWVAYGLALGNFAIVVPNSVAFLVGAATIAIALRFRNAGATDGGPEESASDAALDEAEDAASEDRGEAEADPRHVASAEEAEDGDEDAEDDERPGRE